MPEKRSKFHEFALRSILFKGRPEWYYCYVKSERIAHALSLLEMMAPPRAELLGRLSHMAADLPGTITHLAAGELEAPIVLADIFALLSQLRLAATQNVLRKENATMLEREYEDMAVRLMAGSHPSPFLSSEEFSLPELAAQDALFPAAQSQTVLNKSFIVKDTKGHRGHSPRAEQILAVIKEKKSVSIKDIAAQISGCSEKTIQRELIQLIEEGLIKRVGERRWSLYIPA